MSTDSKNNNNQQKSHKKKDAASVLVRGLPFNATEKEVFDLFTEKVGEVKSVVLIREKGKKKKKDPHRGFGFVCFKLEINAHQAVSKLNNTEFKGRKIFVSLVQKGYKHDNAKKEDAKSKQDTKLQQQKTTVIVRNLSFKISDMFLKKDLHRIFKGCGEIKKIYVPLKKDAAPKDDDQKKKKGDAKKQQTHNGYAFVRFAMEEAAKKATQLTGTKLDGRPIIVDLCGPGQGNDNASRVDAAKAEENGDADEVMDEFKDDDSDNDNNNHDDNNDNNNHDDNNDDAHTKQAEDMDDDELNNIKFEGADNEDDEESEDDDEGEDDSDVDSDDDDNEDDDDEEASDDEDMSDDDDRPRSERLKDKEKRKIKDVQNTLFIRNIPIEAKDKELKEFFEQWGVVIYAVLVKSKVTGQPTGTGFVRFATPAGYQKCIKEAEETKRIAELGRQPTKFGKKQKQYEGVIGQLQFHTREIYLLPALDKNQAKEVNKKDDDNHDKRNLYLAMEGYIKKGSEAAKNLHRRYLDKIKNHFREKKALLKNNPNFSVSKTRLCVRNLPKTVDEKRLKEIFFEAASKLENPQDSHKKPKFVQVKVLRQKGPDGKANTGRPTGIGFVEFTTHEHALAALRYVNNNPNYFGPEKRPMVEFALENALKLMLHRRTSNLGAVRSKAVLKEVKEAREAGIISEKKDEESAADKKEEASDKQQASNKKETNSNNNKNQKEQMNNNNNKKKQQQQNEQQQQQQQQQQDQNENKKRFRSFEDELLADLDESGGDMANGGLKSNGKRRRRKGSDRELKAEMRLEAVMAKYRSNLANEVARTASQAKQFY